MMLQFLACVTVSNVVLYRKSYLFLFHCKIHCWGPITKDRLRKSTYRDSWCKFYLTQEASDMKALENCVPSWTAVPTYSWRNKGSNLMVITQEELRETCGFGLFWTSLCHFPCLKYRATHLLPETLPCWREGEGLSMTLLDFTLIQERKKEKKRKKTTSGTSSLLKCRGNIL